MKRRTFLAVALLTPGCLEFVSEDGEEITDPTNLEVIWDTLVRDNPGTEDERVYVWGVVRYEGERELSYVEIEARFLDEEGESLESVIERVEDITEGDEWTFDVEFPDFGERAGRVVDYELEPVTAV